MQQNSIVPVDGIRSGDEMMYSAVARYGTVANFLRSVKQITYMVRGKHSGDLWLIEEHKQDENVEEVKAMSGLRVNNTLDSREVAEMTGKTHGNLVRDIDTYISYMNESDGIKIDSVDFFLESTYVDAKGESRKCYLVTKKGCEMIAHKLTGSKGIRFTARYIDRFHEMEEQLALPEAKNVVQQLPDASMVRAQAMLMNAQTRQIKLLKETLPADQISKVALQVLELKTFEAVTGANVGPLLPEVETTYSATEAGEILTRELGWQVTANRIGTTANRLGLKTKDNGIEVLDKAKGHNKEVPSYRYNKRGVDALREALRQMPPPKGAQPRA